MADDGGDGRLTFGALEPLVGLMQETPADRLLPRWSRSSKAGTDLRQLVAAAALANARTFGGQDYDGFHTMMALAPAYHMAQRAARGRGAPAGPQGALPQHEPDPGVRRRAHGGAAPGRSRARSRPGTTRARRSARPCAGKDMDGAERTFAALAAGPPDEAFNDLLVAVQDNTEVHRVVLP